MHEHYFSILLSISFGNIYSCTFDDGLKPIIIGGNDHTPYLAFKRYMNTIKRMLAWYNREPWVKDSESYSDMQIIRKKHKMIGEKISQINSKQYYSASKFADPWCPEYELLLKDFALTCLSGELKQRPYKIYDKSFKSITMNNMAIALGQANFIVLPILYPQNIGIYNVTDEDNMIFFYL
ncbi:uncharacterized protein LOC116853721 isoform X2 [Odontomachus brunneus]|uniref:uncharacterized protein LOC116853721 isoform X2 n=1 Tax=Odontomachus brunneus TaxID=486640 RepID=UPI0013F225DB|nr:uncharacterized protein LOC116853721 isoform X2 [Odontomachus brunneus]